MSGNSPACCPKPTAPWPSPGGSCSWRPHMDLRDAAALMSDAVPQCAGLWADFGAGDGTFTRALSRVLGPGARIYAVDRDPAALAILERGVENDGVNVMPVATDFARPFDLPGLGGPRLHGLPLPKALPFLPHPDTGLPRLGPLLRPARRVGLVKSTRRP